MSINGPGDFLICCLQRIPGNFLPKMAYRLKWVNMSWGVRIKIGVLEGAEFRTVWG